MQKLRLTEHLKAVYQDGGDEIGHLYEQVARWYERLLTPTPAQQEIAEAACRAVQRVHRRPSDGDEAIEDLIVTRNMLRFCLVPETHILPDLRAAYLARAEAGEDVYAYGSVHSATGIINVWDWDTRIPLYPLPHHRWNLTDVQQHTPEAQGSMTGKGSRWVLTFARVGNDHEITVMLWIHHQIGDTDEVAYRGRAGRVALMIAHYVNLYGDEPNKYHDHHF